MSEFVTGGAGVIGSNFVPYGVRVVKEVVFDVTVEIRRSLPTFGQLVREFPLAENKRQLRVLESFAHAFGVLSDTNEYLYKTTDDYASERQPSIAWDNPSRVIRWPIECELPLPAIDRQGKPLSRAEHSA